METLALKLVKARLGISSNVRDEYLTAIIKGLIKELAEEKGIILVAENEYHLMYVVDFASWRYQNRDSSGGVPRHLQYRLHNMMISNGGVADGDI
ncbi:hypothetical protein [Planococcus rifietoensis]|uniref:hypothetical protein n=1 Tax=Planococcus rifietoensis TaxID=200991 RepID=UPI00384D1586